MSYFFAAANSLWFDRSGNQGGNLFCLLAHTYIDVEPETAMTLMYIVGIPIGFIGNRKLAFKPKGRFAYCFEVPI
jgi:hypothetical protein